MSLFDIYYKKNDNSKLFSYLSENSKNKIKDIKNFIPLYSRFFSLTESNYDKINLNHKYFEIQINNGRIRKQRRQYGRAIPRH